MDNKAYANILSEIATLQRIAGDNFFKVRAFERAARIIAALPQSVEIMIDDRSIFDMDGIGESIESELQALRVSGASPRHEELIARIGPGVLDLMQINGLGMKRLQILFQELGVTDITALKNAIENGQLSRLSQFGDAVASKLENEIEHWNRTRGKRYPLPEAKGLAESIKHHLLSMDEVHRAEVAGSIRRGKETIGDIDILITTPHAARVSAEFKAFPEATEVLFDGDTRASIRVVGGIQVDLRVLGTHEFGAGLHYFTGSKDHHIKMRIRSKKRGLKISEHGVVRYDDPDAVPIGPMDTEHQIFAAVGLPYIPPEIRMGTEEIPAAENGTLPDLISMTDLRGDLHVRSTRSGGRDDFKKMADTAASFGYDWLCVTERAAPQTNGLDNAGLATHIDAIARFNDGHHPVTLLSGIEVAIDDNGMFGLDVRLITKCDFVVARLTAPSSDPDTNTQRIIWAFESGIVSMLSAPTGRRLGSNDGYPLYFDEIVDQAIDFGVALEMNGHPSFLDLNALNARRAQERGALIALGSDANNALGMSNISYAVQQAKRAWFEPSQVLNCLSAENVVSRVRNLR